MKVGGSGALDGRSGSGPYPVPPAGKGRDVRKPNLTVGRATYGRHWFGRRRPPGFDVYLYGSGQGDDVGFCIY
jgi:hypothetical protein